MKKLLILLLAAAVLSGCAIIRKPAETEAGVVDAAAWAEHRQALTDFDVWSLQGRVATGQLLGWTGNLSWRQQGETFDVRLSGPLGAGGFRAQGSLEDSVVIQTKDERFVTTEPDALVERTLGWTFPLEPLRFWARGLPAPGDYDRISVNAQGRMISLEQNGWALSLPEYVEPENMPAVPRRIVLDNGETRIRLVVDRWFNVDGVSGAN
ncbi:lipoprotein insertase outer membrane protein LolB [Salinisphaera sp.]|uniref:lipoprotein insertase outer membrane protein LolB n=1 Tax=Salinisphaera sp. TaxID=1914330 RepID=UPI000C445BEF|nr:lipoprotein insertase outer membrane protein LolB [Salinisphaera sp.]MBS63192.1 outer membrane lipoprotein LolB [Salinisphaera sp.]